MTPAGIEPATFRFVAQHLKHSDTAVRILGQVDIKTDTTRYVTLKKSRKCYPTWETRSSSFGQKNPHILLNCNIRYSQMKHQLHATLCRFYFCRVTLHVSGASAHHQEYLKLVQRPLVHVLSLQVSHHISLLGPLKWNTNLMQHCAGFISAGSLYMFRAQAPIIRSI